MICRICGDDNDNPVYEVQEMMFGYKDVFHYFQCSGCGCLQIRNFPADMSRYYPESYYSYQGRSSRNKIIHFIIGLRNRYAVYDRGVIGKLIHAIYPNRELRFLSLLPMDKSMKILDVGCGSGTLLYLLRELGFDQTLGVDPFIRKDIEYENGLRVLKKRIGDVEGPWDLVMFHHSFEHVPDPIKTLRNVAGLLNQKGYCVIHIPTVSSYAWRYYGVQWVQLDAPRHFFLHSVESIQVLADKTGLHLRNVVYDSTSFQFWGSEQYRKGIPFYDPNSYAVNPRNSIFTPRDIARFAERADELNAAREGDQAIFYLQKPDMK